MARTGITKTQVRTMRDRLLAEGRHPSADAVRAALGNTGSKSTIHRYLKELAAEEETAGAAHDREHDNEHDREDGLRALIEQLARKVHDETERRLEAIRAAHEQALLAKDAELAALRNTVAALSARLRVPQSGVLDESAPVKTAGPVAGFGPFGDLLANSRSGRQDTSPFNLVRAGGRDNVLEFPAERAA